MAEHILLIEGPEWSGGELDLAEGEYRLHIVPDLDRAIAKAADLREVSVVVSACPEALAAVRATWPGARVLGVDQPADRTLSAGAPAIEWRIAIEALSQERRRDSLMSGVQRHVVRMVDSLALALESRDPYTAGHSQRVAAYSVMIGQSLGLDGYELEVLRHGAALHDIGKIAVRREVLNKPGRLTAEEFEHIQSHPVVGREILEAIEDFAPMLDLVYHHHERIDGRGYPDGLAGEHIPLFAQIVAVADTYDAMTSDRPYRRGMPPHRAFQIMREVADQQLNGELVERLIAGLGMAEAKLA